MKANKRRNDGSLFNAETRRDMERLAEKDGEMPSVFLPEFLCASAFQDPSARHTHDS